MTQAWSKLLRALRDSAVMVDFNADTWDLVVRQAASAGLLARLAALARGAGVEADLPVQVWRHMQAALMMAEQQQRAVRWELTELSRSLAALDGPVLLLKGAAYAAADLAPGQGRLFGDIDLMVPKAQIDQAEAALMLDGWATSHQDTYDQRYYRQWMHELPPMTHLRRRTVLDVHHNILPETARIQTQPAQIIARARPLPSFPRFSIPDPLDLILHSATHLFHEGEWQHGLRDLVDLHALLAQFSGQPGFWDDLLARAEELGLGRPLFYGLRYCEQLMQVSIPAGLLDRCPGRPAGWTAVAMDALFLRAFATAHPSCRRRLSSFAEFALFVRSHWLRMPVHLLAPHLARKFWRAQVERFFPPEKAAQA